MQVSLKVNGEEHNLDVSPSKLLVDFVREDLGSYYSGLSLPKLIFSFSFGQSP